MTTFPGRPPTNIYGETDGSMLVQSGDTFLQQ